MPRIPAQKRSSPQSSQPPRNTRNYAVKALRSLSRPFPYREPEPGNSRICPLEALPEPDGYPRDPTLTRSTRKRPLKQGPTLSRPEPCPDPRSHSGPENPNLAPGRNPKRKRIDFFRGGIRSAERYRHLTPTHEIGTDFRSYNLSRSVIDRRFCL